MKVLERYLEKALSEEDEGGVEGKYAKLIKKEVNKLDKGIGKIAKEAIKNIKMISRDRKKAKSNEDITGFLWEYVEDAKYGEAIADILDSLVDIN
jgi:hypothetical protein